MPEGARGKHLKDFDGQGTIIFQLKFGKKISETQNKERMNVDKNGSLEMIFRC